MRLIATLTVPRCTFGHQTIEPAARWATNDATLHVERFGVSRFNEDSFLGTPPEDRQSRRPVRIGEERGHGRTMSDEEHGYASKRSGGNSFRGTAARLVDILTCPRDRFLVAC